MDGDDRDRTDVDPTGDDLTGDDRTNDDLTKAEQIAKRAADLAARAEELSRQAHEVAGIDDQLTQLERELADLDAEERLLDADLDADADDSRDSPPGGSGDGDPDDRLTAAQRRILDMADTLASRLDGLGDTVSEMIANAVAQVPIGPDTEVELEEPVDGATPVHVVNRAGSINVTTGASDRVRVRAHGRGAGARHGVVPVTIVRRDDAIHVVGPTRSRWLGINRLEVEVPEHSPLDLRMGGGSIDVEGVHGPVTAKAGGGSVTITEPVGPVVAASGGGSINVVNARGSVAARAGGGSVRVSGTLTGDSTIAAGGGSITVSVADGTNISVSARGFNASSDLPGVDSHERGLAGVIGDGSEGSLRVRAGGGGIRITRM